MIRTELIEDRIRHFSDEGYKILQVETGIVYDDAVDVYPCPYTYEETDEPIGDVEIDDSEALRIITGGAAG